MARQSNNISHYSASHTGLAVQVLLEVWAHLGQFRANMVLVGGLAPRFMFKDNTRIAPHCGTMDVDLGLHVAVGRATEYASLREILVADLGFQPGRDRTLPNAQHSFFRTLGNIDVHVDFLTTVYDTPDDIHFRTIEENLRAFETKGLGLALRDPLHVEVRGKLLSGGTTTEIIRVCRPVPFLVLKAIAYESRRKPKDAYDLVYVLQTYQGGGGALARQVRQSESSSPFWNEAIDSLRRHFRSPDENGPVAYGRFLGDRHAATQAFAAVQEFLQAL